MRTLFFKDTQETPDTAWDTLANWWNACTSGGVVSSPAATIPEAGDIVYIVGEIVTGPTVPVVLNAIHAADSLYGGGSFVVVLTGAGGPVIFNNGSYNGGTVDSAIFNDASYNGFGAIVTGSAKFTGTAYSNYLGILNGSVEFSGDSVVFTINTPEVWNYDITSWVFSGTGTPTWNFTGANNEGKITLGIVNFISICVNTGYVENAVFGGSSYNDGATGIVKNATFNDSSYNAGTVSTSAIFTGTAYNDTTLLLGTLNGTIEFTNSSVVFSFTMGFAGDTSSWVFSGTDSYPTWEFTSCVNTGTITKGVSKFLDGSAWNFSSVFDAEFYSTSYSAETITGDANFYDTSKMNSGSVAGDLSFWDSSYCDANITVGGTVTFNETSCNRGTFDTATFKDTSSNGIDPEGPGIITNKATFLGSSFMQNAGSSIGANSVFSDTSILKSGTIGNYVTFDSTSKIQATGSITVGTHATFNLTGSSSFLSVNNIPIDFNVGDYAAFNNTTTEEMHDIYFSIGNYAVFDSCEMYGAKDSQSFTNTSNIGAYATFKGTNRMSEFSIGDNFVITGSVNIGDYGAYYTVILGTTAPLPVVTDVKAGTVYGQEQTGTLKSGGGINGSNILGMM